MGRLLAGVVVLALAACSSLPENVQRPESRALTDTGETLLAKQIEPLTAAHPGESGFLVISDGVEAFGARLRIVNMGQRSIDAQYYIWHNDLTGNVLYNHLLAAADRGVRVRILLDDLDASGKDDILQKIDAHPNVEVRLYNPFSNRSFKTDFITDTDRVNHRMHTKTLTVDNQVTIFGGRNIGDEYFSASEEVGFGDMDAMAVGPIVNEVSDQFDLFWNSEWVYPVSAFPRDEPITEQDMQAFRQQAEQLRVEAQASEYAQIILDSEASDTYSMAEVDFSWSDWFLAYDLPSNAAGGEITAETNLAPRLKQGMDAATTEILIVSPYFVPGAEFTQYLIGRVADGVKVKVLTNSLASNDVGMVHAGYMRYREDLLAGGVEVYEFRALHNTELEEELGRNKIDSQKASLHAKFFGFDRRYLFVGSFNLDARSAVWNTELGAYFEAPEQATEMSEVFDDGIMQFAYRLSLDEDGELTWITLDENGEEVTVDQEPDTSFWQRFNTRILSPLVPEKQL
jgi:putative cardiolipin synthase